MGRSRATNCVRSGYGSKKKTRREENSFLALMTRTDARGANPAPTLLCSFVAELFWSLEEEGNPFLERKTFSQVSRPPPRLLFRGGIDGQKGRFLLLLDGRGWDSARQRGDSSQTPPRPSCKKISRVNESDGGDHFPPSSFFFWQCNGFSHFNKVSFSRWLSLCSRLFRG